LFSPCGSHHQRPSQPERPTVRRALRHHPALGGSPMTTLAYSDPAASFPARDLEPASVISVTHAVPFEGETVSYEINGAAGTPVVAVLGGISASRHVASSPNDLRPGWWEDVVGIARAVDTTRLRVLSIDYVSRSTGQPPVTTDDQARALAAVLD